MTCHVHLRPALRCLCSARPSRRRAEFICLICARRKSAKFRALKVLFIQPSLLTAGFLRQSPISTKSHPANSRHALRFSNPGLARNRPWNACQPGAMVKSRIRNSSTIRTSWARAGLFPVLDCRQHRIDWRLRGRWSCPLYHCLHKRLSDAHKGSGRNTSLHAIETSGLAVELTNASALHLQSGGCKRSGRPFRKRIRQVERPIVNWSESTRLHERVPASMGSYDDKVRYRSTVVARCLDSSGRMRRLFESHQFNASSRAQRRGPDTSGRDNRNHECQFGVGDGHCPI
jgi:hypothetical protein